MIKRNRKCELLAMGACLLFALLMSLLIARYQHETIESSMDYAQILAEILAVIFVLPQVIITVSLRPQRGDIRSVFLSGLTPFYMVIYGVAIIILSCDVHAFIPASNFLKKVFLFFWFTFAIFLILPYLWFLKKE
ncbi:MAG: hypothetical protein SCK70_11715, partial [bacterium]|nr:hypothetical protein [bacterium]